MSEAERIREEYARRERDLGAERYSAADPANLFIRQAVERATLAELRRREVLPLAGRRVLDAGCGAGQWLADFETWGARRGDLAGIDLVSARAAAARERLPGADIREGDSSALPWEDGSFDVVVQSMMLSSVLDPAMRRAIAGEMARVLAPDGLVLSYDFFADNPGNRAVRGLRRRELAGLFPGFDLHWRRTTLAPPLVRMLAPRARGVAAALGTLRLLDTHALASLRRG